MLTISGVVPAYNAEKYIEETLTSLLRQTYPLHEIIVIDDKSSDNTVKIVGRLGTASSVPIKLICQEKNQGVSSARNLGIAAASGDWILFMDADDIAVDELAQTEVDYLLALQKETADHWVVAYPAYSQINACGEDISGVMRGQQLTSCNSFGSELVRNQLITPSGVLVNKAAMLEVGNFKIGLKHQVEDWYLWLQLAQRGGGFAYVDESLVKVRRHSDNATKSMTKALGAEMEVLAFYEIAVIKQAIFARSFSLLDNIVDYVNVLFKLGEWDLGYEELSKADDAQYASVLFLQSLYCLKRNLILQAKDYLERTVKGNPHNGAALNNLGVVHAVLGKTGAARGCLQEALQKFPGYIDAKDNLRVMDEKSSYQLQDFNITSRELRAVLLSYSE
jgi:glycosyltransferase involved in cell wall biosynthesis